MLNDRNSRRHSVPVLNLGAPPLRERVDNIQVLRFMGALMVVLYHASKPPLERLGWQGGTDFLAAGVDIFFVISGFIMIFTTRGFSRTVVEFWIDRIIRIVPVYWAAIAVIVLLFAAGLRPNGLMAFDTSDLLTTLFFIPHVRADGAFAPLLNVGWTLNYEMFFYLVFGLTLFFRSHMVSLSLITALFLGLVAIGLFADFTNATPLAASYTNPIILEFLAGCFLGYLYTHLQRASQKSAATGIALLATGFGGLVLGTAITPVGSGLDPWRAMSAGIPAVLIVSGALMLERSGRKLSAGWMQFMGAASYSIYIFHLLAFQFTGKVIGIFVDTQSAPAAVLVGIALIYIIAGLTAGSFVYVLLERPVVTWLKRVSRGAGIGLGGFRQRARSEGVAAPPPKVPPFP
ncbi:acyltransferase [Paracoccus sp. MBLB3053]|uniref:Acyltransferase n=1 Tax=Paracoccus aurantius TaxID=3073814 RepID=A0ABU2HV64_9RHOB|nr:acyltransferase [Paracoccus sp. MBLB3053]MDS9468938.1 acyltransferase [Paracoccus sp. MBLB3053]